MKKSIIAVPIGDPAGIGPEIVIKALSNQYIAQMADCVVVGDKEIMEYTKEFLHLPHIRINVIHDISERICEENVINLFDLHNIDMKNFRMGEIQGMCGKAAYEYIVKSVQLAMDGIADAVSTAPINKEALKEGNVPYIGHTEICGDLTGTKDPLTMFEVNEMRVFFLTRHVSLRQACDLITKDRIVDYVIRCKEALNKLGVDDDTMAIAGLNPHSGEHGLFGDEEVVSIAPAVEELKKMGYQVEGPISADSVFYQALKKKYNCVLSMYHDQGHIATKTLDFERTISVTAGMPILRTSVDHGTAMDVAGKGIASSVSMEEAIKVAIKYAPRFNGK